VNLTAQDAIDKFMAGLPLRLGSNCGSALLDLEIVDVNQRPWP
jgi:hypothetical protein